MSSPPDKLYFAYGRNLSLQHMAIRCPNSQYVGRAMLLEYCWLFNERGHPNVIPRTSSSVHGLVFRVNGDDENSLDQSEDVQGGTYTKVFKELVLYPTSPELQLPIAGLVDAVRNGAKMEAGEQEHHFEANVLVYLNETIIKRGRPRDEYIGPIRSGMKDATRLGIPEHFIRNSFQSMTPATAIRNINRRVLRPDSAHSAATEATRCRRGPFGTSGESRSRMFQREHVLRRERLHLPALTQPSPDQGMRIMAPPHVASPWLTGGLPYGDSTLHPSGQEETMHFY
ncbi:hypothetical protein BGZ61DRAFT_527724 [Ilyonectria robusta]|uniref:uncharacterized protein n=1 Tax=Ilyonectria robusta TaxID=1079257 RepID=UPI001E8E23A3|nr:uncharacterized protein BGZ61DRAFT_527724 [Ilyonectria robusta]KAH8734370.1 hypothetical protein BGZ61DRAFT_527724 [Ilyonectria robusta]